jgi:hypothetical protein
LGASLLVKRSAKSGITEERRNAWFKRLFFNGNVLQRGLDNLADEDRAVKLSVVDHKHKWPVHHKAQGCRLAKSWLVVRGASSGRHTYVSAGFLDREERFVHHLTQVQQRSPVEVGYYNMW